MKKLRVALLSLFLPLLAAPGLPGAQAAQTGDSETVDFRGTFVLPTPCTIGDDKVLDIVFGNIGVNKVNGSDYAQPIPWSIDCHGAPESALLTLMIKGTAEDFDPAAVVTSADGLGIQLRMNGQPVSLNTPLTTSVGEAGSIALSAVPVKAPSTTLTAQTFSATATLLASYQ